MCNWVCSLKIQCLLKGWECITSMTRWFLHWIYLLIILGNNEGNPSPWSWNFKFRLEFNELVIPWVRTTIIMSSTYIKIHVKFELCPLMKREHSLLYWVKYTLMGNENNLECHYVANCLSSYIDLKFADASWISLHSFDLIWWQDVYAYLLYYISIEESIVYIKLV